MVLPKHAPGSRAPRRCSGWYMNKFSLSPHISLKEQTLLAKRLSFLITAGMPLLECLHLIRSQTRSKSLVRVYDALIKDIANGQYLSTSMAKFGTLFGNFTINIIRVGESSGLLSQNLTYLAEELHKKNLLRRKVLGAL